MSTARSDREWLRSGLVLLIVLVALAPLFGWAATQVGYTEPLEHAAAETGAVDHATVTLPGLLPDYSIPGAPPVVGTLLSGALGTAMVLGIGLTAGWLLQS